MTSGKTYKAIIIGSGQGGNPLAKKLAKKGWKTAIIEKAEMGGSCVNRGCTPTKAMIASARLAFDISKSGDLGIAVPNHRIDFKKVQQRKKDIVETFRSGTEEGLSDVDNLDVIRGKAIFTSSNTVRIELNDGGELELESEYYFIDTGTRPRIPEISGLEENDILSSEDVLNIQELPDHLMIIGGGYIALEFAQMFRRFGSRVTIIERNGQLLRREDEDIAEAIKEILETEGVSIFLNAEISEAKRSGSQTEVQILTEGKVETVLCSHLMAAAGTIPNTDDLNTAAAGIELDGKGYIQVNEKLETTVPNIYAIGDVKGGPEFTHIAYNDHLIICQNLLENTESNISDRPVPYTVFTDPQLGRIGLTEKEATEKQLQYETAKLPMENVARAIETGDTRGFMKVLVDKNSEQIIGVAILGREGGEVMSVLQMAMKGIITWPEIREMVFAHPLYSESLNNLFMKLTRDDQA